MLWNPSPHASVTSSQCGYGRREPVKQRAPMSKHFDENIVIFCDCGRRGRSRTLRQQEGAETVSLENQGFPEIKMKLHIEGHQMG